MKLQVSISARSITNELLKFLESPHPNGWIKGDNMEVYLRKANRVLPGIEHMVGCLDIPNINVRQPFQNKGRFRSFLKFAESLGYPVYVENISNPILESALNRYGYRFIRSQYNASAFKLGSKKAPWSYE